jgi:hypothetical protein
MRPQRVKENQRSLVKGERSSKVDLLLVQAVGHFALTLGRDLMVCRDFSLLRFRGLVLTFELSQPGYLRVSHSNLNVQ